MTAPPLPDDELRQHNPLDSLMQKALMEQHAADWDMETIREAALICSNALIQTPNTAFLQNDTELMRLLDKYGRDIAVSGLKHGGFSASAQKLLKSLQAALEVYLTANRTAHTVAVLEGLLGEIGTPPAGGHYGGYNQALDQCATIIRRAIEKEVIHY